MKIKRYFAADMKSVIKLVRAELGEEAVILSNSQVNGGVEVVAAIDFDAPARKSTATPQPAPSRAQKAHQDKNTASRVQPQVPNRAATPPAAPSAAAGHGYQLPVDLADDITSFRHASAEPAPKAAPSAWQSYVEAAPADPEPLASAGISQEHLTQASSLIKKFAQMQQGTPQSSPKIEWSQDPALVAMREEMQFLRSMMESQLSNLALKDMAVSDPVQYMLMQKLQQVGIITSMAQAISKAIGRPQTEAEAIQLSQKWMAHHMHVAQDDILSQGGLIALLGPTGVGKTTTIAKLAARYALKYGANEVALVSTDSYRIAAHEQLKTYGRILGCTVRIVEGEQALGPVLEQLYDKRLVLIDTAGMSQRDLRLPQQLAQLGYDTVKNYLVLSSTAQSAVLEDCVKAFKATRIAGCILTKLDETLSLGEAISVMIKHRLPLTYVTDGQRVPEDLKVAKANQLIKSAFELAQHREKQLNYEQQRAI